MSREQDRGNVSVQAEEEKEDSHSSLLEKGGAAPSPQARLPRNEGLPVFWAFVVLLATALIVTGFNWAGRVPPAQLQIFSNIAMLAVAAKGFFALGQPSALSTTRLSSTLGNLTVPVLAFYMNINVFGYVIRWDHLPADLWGWHTGWIICAGVQVLFLSGFAQYVLHQMLRLAKAVGHQVKNAASALADKVKLCDKGVLLIFLTGTVLWGVYLGSQIFSRGAQAVFSDVKTLWGSVLLLLVWTIVGVLLYVVPAVCKKSKWTIFGMDGKGIVIAIGVAAAVMAVVLVFSLLALLGGMKVVLTVLVALAVLAALICATVKYSVEKSLQLSGLGKGGMNGGAPDHDTPGQGVPDQSCSGRNCPSVCRKPNPKDVLVTILAYIVIPLTLVCVMAVLSDEIRKMLTTGDYTWQQLMDAIAGLLQFAGNGSQT